MATVSRGTKADQFQFIARHHHKYGVQHLCDHLRVSKSGYYAWLHREEPKRTIEDRKLLTRIKQIHKQSRGTYGSPRIHQALRKQGCYVGRKRVERLMRQEGIQARCARIYFRMGKLRKFFASIENKRLDLPKPSGPNKHWAADVTYIKVKKRWMYLAVVLDLYSRKIVGWSLKRKRTVELTGAALMMAIRKRRPAPGLIFHTDRGIEYRSYAFQKIHDRYGIIPSMNRPGHCTDNAEMESFFHTLKGDMIRNRFFETEQKLRNCLAGYLNNFYNQTRLHSSLGYCSPNEYELLAN